MKKTLFCIIICLLPTICFGQPDHSDSRNDIAEAIFRYGMQNCATSQGMKSPTHYVLRFSSGDLGLDFMSRFVESSLPVITNSEISLKTNQIYSTGEIASPVYIGIIHIKNNANKSAKVIGTCYCEGSGNFVEYNLIFKNAKWHITRVKSGGCLE